MAFSVGVFFRALLFGVSVGNCFPLLKPSVGFLNIDPSTFRHCLPLSLLEGSMPDYDSFLADRRTLMAKKISRESSANLSVTW